MKSRQSNHFIRSNVKLFDNDQIRKDIFKNIGYDSNDSERSSSCSASFPFGGKDSSSCPPIFPFGKACGARRNKILIKGYETVMRNEKKKLSKFQKK
jgi:hypothetical protein